MKRFLAEAIRWITGMLFIFSGGVKLIDPVGTQIKLEEYFEVFAQSFSPLFHQLVPLTLVFAVVFCVAEVVLGVALLSNYKLKLNLWLLSLLIGFFTFLTFYSAYFNKVTDCGCFGDFIKLKPWTSFYKDVVLCVFVAILWATKDELEKVQPAKWVPFLNGFVTAIAFVIAFDALNHLPRIDFRAYHVGANIPEYMKIPEGAEPDVYEITYTLKNAVSGEEKKMSDKQYMDNKIWEDTTWQITNSSDPVLIKEGVKPRIPAFMVMDEDNNDITPTILTGTKLFITVRNVEKADKECFAEINKLVREVEQSKTAEVMSLVSSDKQAFDVFRHEVQLSAAPVYVDATISKTIMRCDPGIWLLKDGVVKGKYHYNDVPTLEVIKKALQ